MVDQQSSELAFTRAANRTAHERNQLIEQLHQSVELGALVDAWGAFELRQARVAAALAQLGEQAEDRAEVDLAVAQVAEETRKIAENPSQVHDRENERCGGRKALSPQRIRRMAERNVDNRNAAMVVKVRQDTDQQIDRLCFRHRLTYDRFARDREAIQKLRQEKKRDNRRTR